METERSLPPDGGLNCWCCCWNAFEVYSPPRLLPSRIRGYVNRPYDDNISLWFLVHWSIDQQIEVDAKMNFTCDIKPKLRLFLMSNWKYFFEVRILTSIHLSWQRGFTPSYSHNVCLIYNLEGLLIAITHRYKSYTTEFLYNTCTDSSCCIVEPRYRSGYVPLCSSAACFCRGYVPECMRPSDDEPVL